MTRLQWNEGGELIPLADDDSLQPPMGSTAQPFVQIELSAVRCFQHPPNVLRPLSRRRSVNCAGEKRRVRRF
ncbi:hypothetical protein NL676_029459 [Syzygium grande]|nr:hypothetical protein NL676_029459 [Syzygium grande]